jgi:hypothetical protein
MKGNGMSGENAGLFMGAFTLALVTIVIVTVVIQVAAAWRARAQLAREDEYRKLASEAVSAGSTSAAGGKLIADELTAIGQRLTAIEKLLKEVG